MPIAHHGHATSDTKSILTAGTSLRSRRHRRLCHGTELTAGVVIASLRSEQTAVV